MMIRPAIFSVAFWICSTGSASLLVAAAAAPRRDSSAMNVAGVTAGAMGPVSKEQSSFLLGQHKVSTLLDLAPLTIPRGGGGRNGGTDAREAPKISIWSEKKHTVLGTTCLKPILYPSLDGLLQLAVFSLAYLRLTGKAREMQLFFLWRIHTPLYFVTNYGAQLPFLPNWPIVPLWAHYAVDVLYTLFNLISPFVIDGYGALKYLYVIGFGLSVALFGIFDPCPLSKQE